MKKIFLLTVLIMITTAGLSQSYSYESIRYYSDREIANLLPNIAKVNPHILDLNLIYSGEILNVPIDGIIVSIYIEIGDNVYYILGIKGIPESKILETKLILSSVKNPPPPPSEKTVSPDLLKRRGPVPPYIWCNIFGISIIFITLPYIYKKLKKATR